MWSLLKRRLCVHHDYSLIPQAEILRCHCGDNECKALIHNKLGQSWWGTCKTRVELPCPLMTGGGQWLSLWALAGPFSPFFFWPLVQFFSPLSWVTGVLLVPTAAFKNNTHAHGRRPPPGAALPTMCPVSLSLLNLGRIIYLDRSPWPTRLREGEFTLLSAVQMANPTQYALPVSLLAGLYPDSPFVNDTARTLRGDVTCPSSQR